MNCNSPARVAITSASAIAIATLLLVPAVVLAGAAETEVLAAHDARIAATIKVDLAALGAQMTEDLTYTHSSGVTETKAEFLAALKSGKYVYRAIDAKQRRVRVHGDVAVVSGPAHVVIEPGGQRTDIDLYFTELYVKQNGRWRMALWHSTRLPAAPAAPAAASTPR